MRSRPLLLACAVAACATTTPPKPTVPPPSIEIIAAPTPGPLTVLEDLPAPPKPTVPPCTGEGIARMCVRLTAGKKAYLWETECDEMRCEGTTDCNVGFGDMLNPLPVLTHGTTLAEARRRIDEAVRGPRPCASRTKEKNDYRLYCDRYGGDAALVRRVYFAEVTGSRGNLHVGWWDFDDAGAATYGEDCEVLDERP